MQVFHSLAGNNNIRFENTADWKIIVLHTVDLDPLEQDFHDTLCTQQPLIILKQ